LHSDIFLIPAVRTPFVKAGTQFEHKTPLTLSAGVMRSMAGRARLDLTAWGQVIPSLTLPNLALEAAMDAGLDATIPAYSPRLA
jgi:acetyl-CoA acetyltransferase